MEQIEFLAILGVFALIAHAYFRGGVHGEKALFAIKLDPLDAASSKRRYRMRKRRALRVVDKRDVAARQIAQEADPTYKAKKMRQRFRRQDDARYNVKDRLAKR